MNKRNWAMIAVFAVIVLLVFFVGVGLLGGWSRGSWGMMGPGMMGGLRYSPLGWTGMTFMWFVPVGIIVLIVVGVAWFVRYINIGGHPIVSWQNCSTCGRSIQADWHNCPYCGTLQAK